MIKKYVLSVKIIESGNSFSPLVILTSDSCNSELNLIGAANAILSKTSLRVDGAIVNDFGEIERSINIIQLGGCIWQYFEKYDCYLGYINIESNIPVNIICCLKEKKE